MERKINNGVFYVVISLVAVLAVVSVVGAYTSYGEPPKNQVINEAGGTVNINEALQEVPVVSEEVLGASPGGYFFMRAIFADNFVRGGGILNASSTLTIARTITASELCNNKTITVNSAAVAATQSAASLDLTFAATSTLFAECLRSNGDEISIDIINQSPTAATTTEIVAGAGCQIVYGVADGDAVIPGQKGATVEIKRIKDWLADGGTKDCILKVYEWN